jgi:plastocyanin
MHEIRPTTRRLAWGALAVAGLALLGGCGDDDDGDDAAETSTPVDTTTGGSDETGAPTTGSSTTGSSGTGEPGAVLIAGYAFDPTPVTVEAGDTVTWTNDDDFAHTSTSDDDLWDSDEITNGSTFEFTFEEPGTYPYHCAIHNFMQGEVVVE